MFPVWFVTTGEVYADWSFLPGGAKLQAQLNQMYDHHLFREYAQVLESILTRLWRDEGGSDQGDLRATVDKYMHKRHSVGLLLLLLDILLRARFIIYIHPNYRRTSRRLRV